MSEEVYTAYGETKTIKEWADEMGITPNTLRRRIKRMGTLEDAISLDVKRSKRRMGVL